MALEDDKERRGHCDIEDLEEVCGDEDNKVALADNLQPGARKRHLPPVLRIYSGDIGGGFSGSRITAGLQQGLSGVV